MDLRRVPTMSPEELIGRSFLVDPRPDGQRFRAEVIDYEVIDDLVEKHESNLERESIMFVGYFLQLGWVTS